tara:strand:+ start:86 stop:502 length:417 start_codon:yes stop_codon:yes gene_type:complete
MKEYEGDRKVFDSEKLKVGDVFYYVEERNMAFKRNKVHKVIDGEDWFKYDTSLRTYKIITRTVLGILRKTIEGQWEKSMFDPPDRTEFFVSYEDESGLKKGQQEMSSFDFGDCCFVDKAEALVHKEHMEVQARELDLK